VPKTVCDVMLATTRRAAAAAAAAAALAVGFSRRPAPPHARRRALGNALAAAYADDAGVQPPREFIWGFAATGVVVGVGVVGVAECTGDEVATRGGMPGPSRGAAAGALAVGGAGGSGALAVGGAGGSAVGSKGESVSWRAQQSNVLRIFEQFREHNNTSPEGNLKIPAEFHSLGRAVQVDPMKPKLKAPGTKSLKLKCDILLLTSAFNFNLRRYISAKMRCATRRCSRASRST
jgi:hypothetical protein